MTSELDLSLIYFNPRDILLIILVLTLIIIWTNLKSNNILDQKEATIYKLSVYFKLLLATVFAMFFSMFVFKGGDTLSYWRTTEVLKNVFFADFSRFLEIMNTIPTNESFSGLFNYKTGYPPSYIYREEESFFVAKLIFFLNLLTFGSYLGVTFIMAFMMANASWKVYTLIQQYSIFHKKLTIVFALFMPSVAFWASGVSKDTVALISILNLIYFINYIQKQRFKFSYFLLILFYSYVILHIRPFIFYAMAIPMGAMYVMGAINKIKDFALLKNLIKIGLVLGIVGGSLLALRTINLEEMIMTNSNVTSAVVVQQDFVNNTATYGGYDGKRYSLGDADLTSFSGLVSVIPASIIAGIYRPFPWEALTPSLLFNGLESLLLLALSVNFIFNRPRKRIQVMMNNELLVFSIGFVLVIGFMTGFTSILFGVLVRLRAPLLLFFGLMLSIDLKKVAELEEIEEEENGSK